MHSLHSYFLLAGKNDTTILFSVTRVRDGRSFITREVKAMQEKRPIFTVTMSFHRPEPGPEYQIPLTDMQAYLSFRMADVRKPRYVVC
jgi:acyl-CoA thioesterase II